MRRRLFLCLLGVCASAAAFAQTFPATPISSTVPAGVRRQLGFFTSLNADCSTTGDIQSRVLKQPSNGVVELEDGYGYPNYPLISLRYLCNMGMVIGVRVFYTSKDGYIGKDAFAAQFFTPNGAEVVWKYSVTVK